MKITNETKQTTKEINGCHFSLNSQDLISPTKKNWQTHAGNIVQGKSPKRTTHFHHDSSTKQSNREEIQT